MKRLIYSIIFIVFLANVYAQPTYFFLKFDSVQNTVFQENLFNTIYINARLIGTDTNMQPAQFVSNVDFYLLSDSMIQDGTPALNFHSQIISMFGGQTQMLNIPLVLDTAGMRLKAGPNVIIVWPGYVGSGFEPLDSLELQVFLLSYIGLPPGDDSDIYYYPNPVSDQLIIVSDDRPAREIVLLDAHGRVVRRLQVPESQASHTIFLQGLSPGIYTVIVKLNDGSDKVFKALKM